MKWYTYNQNNSGGYFIRNEVVADCVIIQAESPELADEKMFKLTEDYSGFCQCCGERWRIDSNESSGRDVPMFYDKKIRGNFEPFDKRNAYALLHFADGSVERVNPTI